MIFYVFLSNSLLFSIGNYILDPNTMSPASREDAYIYVGVTLICIFQVSKSFLILGLLIIFLISYVASYNLIVGFGFVI